MSWIEIILRVAIGLALLVMAYQLGRRVERRSWLALGQQWCNLAEQTRQTLRRVLEARRAAEEQEWAANERDAQRRQPSEYDIEQPDVVCAQCQASYPPILSECPRCKVKCGACRAAMFGSGRVVDLQPGDLYLRQPCPECGLLRYQPSSLEELFGSRDIS
jgi:hypothetical protein